YAYGWYLAAINMIGCLTLGAGTMVIVRDGIFFDSQRWKEVAAALAFYSLGFVLEGYHERWGITMILVSLAIVVFIYGQHFMKKATKTAFDYAKLLWIVVGAVCTVIAVFLQDGMWPMGPITWVMWVLVVWYTVDRLFSPIEA
ncbi:MAG TPA: hypothetical protein DCP28_32200, partial [Cytophagales bacterium]|nr:hypothetical protein [Cytophagales bacterium]